MTLLSNAIAAATTLNTTKNNNGLQTNTTATPPLTNHDSALQKEKDETKQEQCSSPSKENAQDSTEQTKIDEQDKNQPNTCQIQSSSTGNKKSHVMIPQAPVPNNNTSFENPLLQTFLASILHNQLINNSNNRKINKGTQTIERIITPSPHLIRAATTNNISSAGFQQQQLINNTFLTSNYKFHGLAKTSSVYFTRGIR